MAINKVKTLGKQPSELGVKDAVHVAIVSVRAGEWIDPGMKVELNSDGEAVRGGKLGLADPFLKSRIKKGDYFWMMVDSKDISSVVHTWDHPKHNFTPPTHQVKKNHILGSYADELGVSYEDLMLALDNAYNENQPLLYPGKLSEDELDVKCDEIDSYDLWWEWTNETGYDFDNIGTECCPEYECPSMCSLWRYPQDIISE